MSDNTPTTLSELKISEQEPLTGIRCGCVIRPEPLYHRRTRLVLDTHRNPEHNILMNGVEEVEFQNLQLFSLDKLFDNKREIFLGFGLPNVYLTMPNENFDGYVKFAAFILWRQRSTVLDTKERVQSGILIRFRNYPDELLKVIREAVKLNINQRHVSCAYANACVLHSASITSGGSDLCYHFSARSLFQRIYENGLEFRGEPLTLDFIRTTPRSLEEHFHEVRKKEFSSLGRTYKKVINECTSSDNKIRAPLLPADDIPMKPTVIGDANTAVRLEISHPYRLGALVRKVFGSHTLFRITPMDESINIDAILPETLKAFPSPNPDLFTRIKKTFLFSRPVVLTIRKQLAAMWDDHGSFSPGPIACMMSIHKKNDPHVYNVVITGSHITGMHNNLFLNMKIIDWIMSKHVLISGYDDDVRFAGEAWMEHSEGGLLLHLTNNSGTYQPNEEQLEAAGQLISKTLPGLRVELHSSKNQTPINTTPVKNHKISFIWNVLVGLIAFGFWLLFVFYGFTTN